MATCPAGHSSSSDDYCDICGLPIEPGSIGSGHGAAARAAATPVGPPGAQCPNCGTMNAPDALFCEACGYDFTTGTPPRSATAAATHPEGPPAQAPVEAPAAAEPTAAASFEPDDAPQPSPAGPDPEEPATLAAESPAPVPDPVSPAPSEPWEAPAVPAHGGRLLRSQPTTVEWVAEVWIDPDWYATQGSTDALPSAGLPEVVPLRTSSVLIGRVSVSRNIHPEIDCDPDTGVSRRHAQISTDGTRWWIEDLESANGTFVAPSAGQLPSMPIGRGRVEFAPDQRLYLGGWTRLVIRRATEDEQQAFAS